METKLLLIDVGYLEYFKCFSFECRKRLNTTVVTKYNTTDDNSLSYFYKVSEEMKESNLRLVIKFIEYIIGYIRVLKLVKIEKFDIIHIHWAIVPQVDAFFFKLLKKHTNKLIYTAHDVIPHTPTMKKIKKLNKLYAIPDRIIVHGEYCKNELQYYFPLSYSKVYKQEFGAPEKKIIPFNEELFDKHKKIQTLKKMANIKVITFIGQISYYKGLDILLDGWKVIGDRKDLYLIVVGKIIEAYPGLENKINSIRHYNNVFIYNEKYSDEEETFFHALSDLIILPYRSASMSGVLYTAAKHSKTVLSTKAGCLKEYLEHTDQIFICKDTVESIVQNILMITDKYTKEELKVMGNNFSNYIFEKYDWGNIIEKLIKDCYQIYLED